MIRQMNMIFVVIMSLSFHVFADEGSTLVFDDVADLYIYKDGEDPSKPVIKKIKLKTLKGDLREFIVIEALKAQKNDEDLAGQEVHVTPKMDDSYYQITMELRNSKTKNYVRLRYGLSKKKLSKNERLKNTKGGRLLIAYLQKSLENYNLQKSDAK
ncbi:MAG: hypothetical protein ACSHX6_10775 [Akkermansiaceae bacterium]